MQLIAIVVGIYILTVLYGWAVSASQNQERKRIQKLLDERDKLFNDSFSKGRQWLANFVADCRKAYDDSVEGYLRRKSHPAQKAADVVRDIKFEKRQLNYQLKLLEYQLLSYEEYFPFLESTKMQY